MWSLHSASSRASPRIPPPKNGGHDYDAADYGLNTERILADFADCGTQSGF